MFYFTLYIYIDATLSVRLFTVRWRSVVRTNTAPPTSPRFAACPPSPPRYPFTIKRRIILYTDARRTKIFPYSMYLAFSSHPHDRVNISFLANWKKACFICGHGRGRKKREKSRQSQGNDQNLNFFFFAKNKPTHLLICSIHSLTLNRKIIRSINYHPVKCKCSNWKYSSFGGMLSEKNLLDRNVICFVPYILQAPLICVINT